MVACSFSLMGNKMNTKKLVLGFCVLAAITGGSAHGAASGAHVEVSGGGGEICVVTFDDGFDVHKVKFSRQAGEVDIFGIVYNGMMAERKQQIESLLEEKNRELRDQTNEYRDLCRMEVAYVKNALFHEHREHFRREFASELEEAEKETTQIRECISLAENFVRKIDLFGSERRQLEKQIYEGIQVLKSDLEEALRRKGALEANLKSLSDRDDELAKKIKAAANWGHIQRISYLTDINKAEEDNRVTNGAQARELTSVTRVLGSKVTATVSELEDIVVNGLKDIAVMNEAFFRHKLAENTIAAIENAIQRQMEWSDSYLDYCSDPVLCRKIHDKYRSEIGYNYSSTWQFDRQRDLRLSAIKGSALVPAVWTLQRERTLISARAGAVQRRER
jgi:DNA repair exonuclease SbcCD ATPase subunit